MVDRLFVDVRQFAAPPGRPLAGERFERQPGRAVVRRLARRWLSRWRNADAFDPLAPIPDYLPTDWDVSPRHR